MKHLIMGTAGHVDHGKTSLIKALTSIDCDTHQQEKERGITINLGFSHLDLASGNSLGIVDMPGHKDFINTMVSGAIGIDFVLLVIAADSGIMPQTREHFNIIQTLGVKKMIVALNKIDLVDEELAELAKLEIMEWLEETDYANTPIVGVSSTNLSGLDELIREIENLIPEIPNRPSSSFFRMYIDRLFTVKGKGTVIAGSVLNGELHSEDELYVLPGNQSLRIKGMHRHGKATKKVVSGDRAAINVSGFPKEEFRRGMLVSNQQLDSTKMIDVQVHLFPNVKKLKLWSNVILHAATFECQARMHLIDTDQLEAENSCIAQLILEEEEILLPKDHFILRRSSGDETIGGGVVIDAQPLHHRKRTQKLIQHLQQLSEGLLSEGKLANLVLLEVDKAGHPLKLKELFHRLKMEPSDLDVDLANIAGLAYYPSENILATESYEERIERRLVEILKGNHLKNPLVERGLSLNELLGKFEHASEASFIEFFPIFLQKLFKQELLNKVDDSWVLKSHQVKLTPKTKEEIDWLEQLIKTYESQKPIYPDIDEQVKARKIPKEKFQQYLDFLAAKKKLTFFKGDYVHSHWVKVYRKKMLEILSQEEAGLYQQPLKAKTALSKKMLPFLCELLSSEKLIKTSDFNKENFKSEITELGRKFLEIT
jgi:selenocysteine-specific elongation factor